MTASLLKYLCLNSHMSFFFFFLPIVGSKSNWEFWQEVAVIENKYGEAYTHYGEVHPFQFTLICLINRKRDVYIFFLLLFVFWPESCFCHFSGYE